MPGNIPIRGAVAGRLPADHHTWQRKSIQFLEDSAVSLLERRNPALRTQKQRDTRRGFRIRLEKCGETGTSASPSIC